MTKLSYTDPLKAAWMAREFGVKYNIYITGSIGRPEVLVPQVWDDFEQYGVDFVFPSKHYIQSGSYPIFEPRVGDMVDMVDMGNDCIVRIQGICDNVYLYDANGAGFECPYYDKGGKITYEIIKRNGKHFFMPENNPT